MEEETTTNSSLFVAIYALLSGVAPLCSALFPLLLSSRGGSGFSPRTTYILLGFSAGLLFAIATLDLIPTAVQMESSSSSSSSHHHQEEEGASSHAHFHTNQDVSEKEMSEDHHHDHSSLSMVGVGVGYFCLLFVEQLMASTGHGHSHGIVKKDKKKEKEGGEEKRKKFQRTSTSTTDFKVSIVPGSYEDDEKMTIDEMSLDEGTSPPISSSLSLIVPVGLGIHSIVDGLIVAGAMSASDEIGMKVIFAIILHKIPDGIVLSSVLIHQLEKRTLIIIVLVSCMTPFGIFLGTYLFSGLEISHLAIVLGFGSGTFIYISATGIVPELTAHRIFALPALIAFVIAYLSILMMESLLHAH